MNQIHIYKYNIESRLYSIDHRIQYYIVVIDEVYIGISESSTGLLD